MTVQLISRSAQTVPSAHGSEATFHGQHLHRPLLLLVLWCPIVSLLNGAALFLYWKPKALSQSRLDGDSVADPAYYCFVCALFLHFVLGNAFVVQRGVRSLVGQRTYQQRVVEVQHATLTFALLTLPLFFAHIALSERLKVFTPSSSTSPLDTDAIEQEKSAVAFVRLVLWGTPASAGLVGWYWWLFTFSEKLQKGVRKFADKEVHARRSRQYDWHNELAAAMEKAKSRRRAAATGPPPGRVAPPGLFDAMEGGSQATGGPEYAD